MTSLLLSRRDIDFLLYDWLSVEELTKRDEYADQSRDTFDALLDICEQVATRHFAPHNRALDLTEPEFDGDRVVMPGIVKESLDVFAQTGLLGMTLPRAHGGSPVPRAVTTACFAWFQAANLALSAYPFLTIGNLNLLLAHGDATQIDLWVRPMVEGRFFGTMCLSEPQAGSSLSDITTRAEPAPDGTFRLFGNKMWISGGDHELAENIVHLVLAKIPGAPAGVKGISLFIVPRFLLDQDRRCSQRNDVALVGLNHKMGYRGTVNTVLNFGEGRYLPDGAPGAVGYLVGQPNEGLGYMFHMMNESRIGVGAGAAALGYTGYLKSLDYARSRQQGRPPGAKDRSRPQVPIIAHADVRRMLLAQKAYAEGALALVLYCGRLLDEERSAHDEAGRRRGRLLLELLTPVAKSWPSQWCLVANDLAIQVHGGYGYTRGYDVEQHYRDNRLNPIHEGTHGIQALDLLGRKVAMSRGEALSCLGEEVLRAVYRASNYDAQTAEFGAALQLAWERVVAVTSRLLAAGSPEVTLANASVYLEAFGHVIIAWIWLEQVLATDGRTDDFSRGKRQAGRYFFRYELPRTGPLFDLLERLDRTALDMADGWF